MSKLSKIKDYLVDEIRRCDTRHFYGESEDEINEEYLKNKGREFALQEVLDLINND